MTQQLFHLCRSGVSLLVETSEGTPNIIYWGAELTGPIDETQYLLAVTEPAPHGYYDHAHRGGVWRENARGFWGRPAILGNRGGRDWSQLFTLVTAEQPTADSLRFVSRDSDLGVEVELRYHITESGLLLADHTITNLHDGDFTLENSTVFFAVPDHATEYLDFTGRWLKERQPQRGKINTGIWQRESREGRSGHDYTLVQFVMTAAAELPRVGFELAANLRLTLRPLEHDEVFEQARLVVVEGGEVLVLHVDHRLQLVRVLRREILPLGGIGRQVEELPVTLSEGPPLPAQLPVPLPDGAIAEKLPREHVLVRARRFGPALQHRQPGLAQRWKYVLALPITYILLAISPRRLQTFFLLALVILTSAVFDT